VHVEASVQVEQLKMSVLHSVQTPEIGMNPEPQEVHKIELEQSKQFVMVVQLMQFRLGVDVVVLM
jgi:hypothetical protein